MSESSCELTDDERDNLQYVLDKIAETLLADPKGDEELIRESFKRLKKLNHQKFGEYVDRFITALDELHAVWKEMGDVFDVGEYREHKKSRTRKIQKNI